MISRRQSLALAGAAVVVGAGGFAANFDRQAVRAILDKHFPDLAGSSEIKPFVEDFLAVWSQNEPRRARIKTGVAWSTGGVIGRRPEDAADLEHGLVNLFIRSTTYIRSRETGEPMEYFGLALPPGHVCANPLSAAWL